MLALICGVFGVVEQVVFTDHSLFGFADMASILMNKVGTNQSRTFATECCISPTVASSAVHDGFRRILRLGDVTLDAGQSRC